MKYFSRPHNIWNDLRSNLIENAVYLLEYFFLFYLPCPLIDVGNKVNGIQNEISINIIFQSCYTTYVLLRLILLHFLMNFVNLMRFNCRTLSNVNMWKFLNKGDIYTFL